MLLFERIIKDSVNPYQIGENKSYY